MWGEPTTWLEPKHWPWGPEAYKPTPEDRERELVKAGALVVAELERLKRADERERDDATEREQQAGHHRVGAATRHHFMQRYGSWG